MRTPSERAKAGLPVEGVSRRARAKAKEAEKVVEATANAAVATNDDSVLQTEGDLQDIWDRRILNPSQRPDHPIRIKRPGMHLRWINLASNGRYQRARYEEGWQSVPKDQLVDPREIYGVNYTTEGWVCRGEKQQEMLMWIPEVVWKKIRQAKIAEVKKSQRHIKESMMQDGTKHFTDKYGSKGEQIAASLGNFKGDVKFGTEQVEPDEEELAALQGAQ